MRNCIFLILTVFILKSQIVLAEIPQVEISNGLITAKLYLPDAEQGYYQGSRFDWSGVISELKYEGHDYFGQWFSNYNPKTHDAICGPVEEFSAINYNQTPVGGEFVRIGIGGLRKSSENRLDGFGYYELSNPGKWTVKKTEDCVVFTHQLNDVAGYSYLYEKKVRLVKGKPQMVLEHSLKNTGKKVIQTDAYCHNFFTIDNQPTGPNNVVKFAFPVNGTNERPLAKINGQQVEFIREFSPSETVFFGDIQGHNKSVKGYDFRIENTMTGAGVRITSDRPVSKINFWASATTQCPEPFIDINVQPGKTFSWTITYDFYTPFTIKQQDNGMELSWAKIEGAKGYNLYRSDTRFGDYKLINASPIKKTTFFDNGNKYAYYKVAPVIAGKEGELSAPHSLELELFGSNTYIFNPNDSQEDMKQIIDTISTELANGRISQFTNKRAAFLFKPGNYDWLQFENGFYMQVAGLGKLPTDTKIDKVYVTTDWLRNKNATCNFWRAIENVSLLNKDGEMLIYGISQAAPIRRMMISGNINLDMGGWASGGFLANSVVTGTAGSPTQQQFFIRNNETKFKGVNWSLVSIGNKGEIEMKDNRSIIDTTPVIYEKPFLFFENDDYFVFVPERIENAGGASWSNGKSENGKVIPLSDFYIARCDRDNAKTINEALEQGKHILFTPGIYETSEVIEVKKANTVILGLGLATIHPTKGNDGMYVADLEGIRIAGLIFDAGTGLNENTDTGGSKILLQVGPRGSKKDLSKNPIVLSDLFFRVGGVDTPLPCMADISLEINANSTIGDHFWIWRADHGGKVGWELNKADYGLIVNGNDVTIYGLFVEHYQKYDTYWTGENGRMYFYQNEKAYDVPTQEDWIGPDGNRNGWAAYRVADNVKKHEAWGVGVYSVFNRTKEFVLLENGIVTPPNGDIVIHYPFTINLSNNGGIEHIINGLGGPHTSKDSRTGSIKILPESYKNVWNAAPLFMLPSNSPQGEAKGIFPGRVAWVYAPNTANWDEESGFWFDDRWNNQSNCDNMIRQSLFTLTGKNKEKEAWTALFSHFNKNKGKKTLTYQPKEKIAIKINQNNTYSHEDSEELNASPHLLLSLLRSLIKEAGVPQEQITVLEPSRFLTDYLYKKCASEFPRVKYVDNTGGDGRIKSTYTLGAIPYSTDNGDLATGLSTHLVEADYIINMAILKGHVGQGITLCAKNWYGATNIHADWRKNAHNNFDQDRKGKAKYMTFVDFMGHKYTGEKTLIYFIDGLYGSQNVAGKPSGKWNLAPFNGDWPNSLFASQDPIAIDAVGLDFLSSEWPGMVDINYADMYLLEAAMADDPPSGAFYDPEKDGTRLKSLGVLEHWNNANDKQYSRNLSKKEGIELVFKKL